MKIFCQVELTSIVFYSVCILHDFRDELRVWADSSKAAPAWTKTCLGAVATPLASRGKLDEGLDD